MNTFNKGDDVYNIQGQGASYVTEMGGRHLVQPKYEDSEGEVYLDDPEMWPEVFSEPPTEVLHEEIQKLEQRRDAITSIISDLQAQQRDENKRVSEMLAKLNKFDCLRGIEDFINGNLTHLVLEGHYNKADIRVVPITENLASDSGNEYDRKLRLLWIKGNSRNGKLSLQWCAGSYSDGSGTNYQIVHPCRSEQEAKDKAAELIAPFFTDQASVHANKEGVASAKAIGMTVPADVIERIKAHDQAAAVKELTDLEKNYADKKAKLQAAIATI